MKILTFLLTSLLLVSCSKNAIDRPLQFDKDQGVGLLKVSDIDNATATLKTANQDESLRLKSTNALYEVSQYETDSTFIPKDMNFIGKKGQKYKLRYELTNNGLHVMKEVSIKELEDAEREVSKAMVSKFGTVLVPWFTLGVSYYVIEQKTNKDGEASHLLVEKAVQSKAEATHVRIDREMVITENPLLK